MVRKHLALLALVMLAVFAVACGGGNNTGNSGSSSSGSSGESAPDMKTPEGTLKIYQQALKDQDAAKAASCGKKADLEKNKTSLEKRMAKVKEAKQTLEFTFSDVKIDGDKATCKIVFIIKGPDGKELRKEEEEMPLVKEDGEWRIADL
ncbi:MAG: DUF4878 domain-containing protein [Planctomycetes bacterium]|nr:DUF4878 domain-containing protein [Planctomycetota bacterium]